MAVPVTITIPKTAMPAGGWPLFQFFHGSGGLSTGLVDLGYSPTPDDILKISTRLEQRQGHLSAALSCRDAGAIDVDGRDAACAWLDAHGIRSSKSPPSHSVSARVTARR